MRAFLLIALAVAASGAEFFVDVDYECTASNAQGACVQWKQSGKIHSPEGVCFPPSQRVQTPNGHKSLGEVEIGDEILTMTRNGHLVFSQVRAWLHRDPTSAVTYLVLKTAAGTLHVSPAHNVYIASADGGTFVHAKHVKVGDLLRAPAGPAKVMEITEIVEEGAFAPLTYESTLFIGTNESSLLLAHSYAGLVSPTFWKVTAFNALLSAAELAVSDLHVVEDPSAPYLHPVVRAVAPLFGLAAEAKVVKDFNAATHPHQEHRGHREGRHLYATAAPAAGIGEMPHMLYQVAQLPMLIRSNVPTTGTAPVLAPMPPAVPSPPTQPTPSGPATPPSPFKAEVVKQSGDAGAPIAIIGAGSQRLSNFTIEGRLRRLQELEHEDH